MISDRGSIGKSTLTLAVLLKAEPSHHGHVLKLHIPPIFLFLPAFLERILVSSWFCKWFPCSYLFIPRWKRRYLVLLGNYVYRFDDDNETDEPKGSPTPVDSIQTRITHTSQSIQYVSEDADMATVIKATMPIGYKGCFVIESGDGKCRYFATATAIDATTWVNSLTSGSKESITRQMGHASHIPYPASWKVIDNLGKDLYARKERIKNKMRSVENSDFESSSMGTLPKGYFG
jgi:hypothetical protein